MTRHSGLRRGGLATALAIVALMAFAGSAPAATKDYSLTIAPSTVLAGKVVAMSATIKNLTGQQQLGSANLTPPGGYAALSITSLSRPAPASAAIVGGVVQLRSLSLQPQESVTVSFDASTPCSPNTSSQWNDVVAKQANDFNGTGNDLLLDTTQSSLTTTTTGACTPCPENTSCSASLGGPGGSLTNVVSPPNATQPDAGVLTLSNTSVLDCPGYQERSSDVFILDAPQNRVVQGSLTFSSSTRPITSKDPLEVCWAAPTPFSPKKGTPTTTTIIDGLVWYVGRLPDCTGRIKPPCVTNRDNATRTIQFTKPAGDPHYG